MLADILDQQGTLFNKLQKNIIKGINYRLFNESSTTLDDKRKENLKTGLKLKTRWKDGFTDQSTNKAYEDVSAQYTQSQTDLQTNNLNILKRMDSKTNAMLGKNISLDMSGSLDNSTKGYVTDQGVFKAYNPSTWSNVPGKFGCPSTASVVRAPVNENDQINASVPGYTFTTENFPKLLVGQPMQSGAACGNAGKNVYVDRVVDNPNAKYVGCYSNVSATDNGGDGTSAMTNIGAMDYSSCLKNALNNGYTYFGITTEADSTQCLVSKSLDDVQQFGSPISLVPQLLWESKTTGTGNYCAVTNDGTLTVYNSDALTLFQSNVPVASCIHGGGLNKLVATFGGNCDDKYNVKTGNATDAVMDAYNNAGNNQQFSFLINGDNIGANPADGCKKSWDAAYQCGDVSKTSNIKGASGKYAQFNCKTEIVACSFVFILQNNGTACLKKSTKDNTNIWCIPFTTGIIYEPNPEFVANKGKTGTNTLSSGQLLVVEEWIGADNGSLKLIMQTDGNLCLYSYSKVDTCVLSDASNPNSVIGRPNINAVYQVNASGNTQAIGNMGFIDKDDVLHAYDLNALEYSDKYTILQNMNSVGNDLTTIPNSTAGLCNASCTENDLCAGYTYASSSNVCYLKNNNMYPKTGELTTTNDTTTGIRLPRPISSISCATETQNISSEQYDHYIKGDDLSKEDELDRDNWNRICNPFASDSLSKKNKEQYNVANDNLERLGKQMTDTTNVFGAEINGLQDDFLQNSRNMMKSVRTYKNKTKDGFSTIKTFVDVWTNNNKTKSKDKGNNYDGKNKAKNNNNINAKYKEGMLNMYDLHQMKDDSALNVSHDNMMYIYWTLIAIGLATACMAMLKNN